VLERIEATTEPYLIDGGLEEYRRFLELYLLLDEELTRKLAQRALAHLDPDVDEHLCGRFVRRNHFGLSIPAVIAKFHQLLVFVYYVGANLTGN